MTLKESPLLLEDEKNISINLVIGLGQSIPYGFTGVVKCIKFEKNPTISFYYNGYLHREDGPAFISREEETWYYFNNKHRLDGPAYQSFTTGVVEYYIHGRVYGFTSFLEHPKTSFNRSASKDGTPMDGGVPPGHFRTDSVLNIPRNFTGIAHIASPYIGESEILQLHYANGCLHCVNGPAKRWKTGQKEYYLVGKNLSEKEFKDCQEEIKEIDEAALTLISKLKWHTWFVGLELVWDISKRTYILLVVTHQRYLQNPEAIPLNIQFSKNQSIPVQESKKV